MKKYLILVVFITSFTTIFAQPGYMGKLNYIELNGILTPAWLNVNYQGNKGFGNFSLTKGIQYNRVVSRKIVLGLGYQHSRTGVEITPKNIKLDNYYYSNNYYNVDAVFDEYANSSNYNYYNSYNDVFNINGDDPYSLAEDEDSYYSYYNSNNDSVLFIQNLKISTIQLEMKVFGDYYNVAAPLGSYWGLGLQKHTIYLEDNYTKNNIASTGLYEMKILAGVQKLYFEKLLVNFAIEIDASFWNWAGNYFYLENDIYDNDEFTSEIIESNILNVSKYRVSQMHYFNGKLGVAYLF